jgi:hypothetical protein
MGTAWVLAISLASKLVGCFYKSMKVAFSVVPPGGGESDYSFNYEMPAIPSAGDYVFVQDSEVGAGGAVWAAFIVRRRWFWPGAKPEDENILVEVEPARYYLESDKHKATCDSYAKKGKPLQEIQNSCY